MCDLKIAQQHTLLTALIGPIFHAPILLSVSKQSIETVLE
jgi:hypothetical protein